MIICSFAHLYGRLCKDNTQSTKDMTNNRFKNSFYTIQCVQTCNQCVARRGASTSVTLTSKSYLINKVRELKMSQVHNLIDLRGLWSICQETYSHSRSLIICLSRNQCIISPYLKRFSNPHKMSNTYDLVHDACRVATQFGASLKKWLGPTNNI